MYCHVTLQLCLCSMHNDLLYCLQPPEIKLCYIEFCRFWYNGWCPMSDFLDRKRPILMFRLHSGLCRCRWLPSCLSSTSTCLLRCLCRRRHGSFAAMSAPETISWTPPDAAGCMAQCRRELNIQWLPVRGRLWACIGPKLGLGLML